MTKTYRFADCTNQIVEASDSDGNKWVFMADDNGNPAQIAWAETVPLPEIELCNDPCPPDPDFVP